MSGWKGRVLSSVLLLALSTATLAADAHKVLRVAFSAPETGFDPAKVSDVYSSAVTESVFDTLLGYDYLARPARLVPNVLTAMPEVSADGKVYTFHLQRGIHFAPDPVFKGKKRELTAADFAYSIKRLADPAVGSPSSYLVTGKFVGLDALVKKAGKGRLDYNAPVAGIATPDRYTLRLTLTAPQPALPYILAMPTLGAVAREVIEAYGNNTHAHPVGTGPYMLREWKPGNHISLVVNPNFRKVVFHYRPGADPLDRRIAREMNGKTMPQIGRVEISVIQEEQPMWLAFRSGDLDMGGIPQPVVRQALILDPKNPWRVALKPALQQKGVRLLRSLDEEITYFPFNMQDPVVGGYGKDKIALRRAIAMAFNTDDTILNIRRNQAVKAQYLIPDNVAGHNPRFRAAVPYNPALANALLDRFGYRLGPDGKRRQPDGRPLVVDFITGPTAVDKQWNEYWQQAFDAIKVRVNFRVMQWNEQGKTLRDCQYGMAGAAWLADYPDGDNFVQLLYGKNVGDSNLACYRSARFDKLYEAAARAPDGPARNQLYDQMNKVFMADTPWVLGETRFRNLLVQRWVQGAKPHPQLMSMWRYLDIVGR